MKMRIVALTLSFALIAALAGCGTGGEDVQNSPDAGSGTESETAGQAPSSSDDKLRIAFIPQLIGIPYFTAMEDGGNAAAQDLGVEFLNQGSTVANAVEQAKIMDSLIRQGVDAIAVSALDSKSINPYMESAKEAGILAYTSDSDTADGPREFFVCQALDEDMGIMLIDELVKQTGDTAQIGFVSGESTAGNLNSWIAAMERRVAEKYPNVEIVDVRYTTDGSSEDALKQTQEMMIKYPDIKGFVGVATSTVPGVAQAVQQAGKTGEIAVIGVASPEVVKPYIESGVMESAVLWNAKDLGYLTVWAAYTWINEGAFPAEIELDALESTVIWMEEEKTLLLGVPLLINAENVDNYDF